MLTDHLLCVIVEVVSGNQKLSCWVMEVNKKPLFKRNLKVASKKKRVFSPCWQKELVSWRMDSAHSRPKLATLPFCVSDRFHCGRQWPLFSSRTWLDYLVSWFEELVFAVGLCSERTPGKHGTLSVGHPKGWRNSAYSLVKLLHLYGFSDKVFHVREPKLYYRHCECFFGIFWGGENADSSMSHLGPCWFLMPSYLNEYTGQSLS